MKPHDPLDDLLATWDPETPEEPAFHREVWHRIAAAPDELSWAEKFLNWWMRPRRLIGTALACICLGSALGFFDALQQRGRARDAYLSAINPLDSRHLHHTAP
ncbi:MAG: hypothetical protein ABMA01_09655 [Chthoniobacteraceae bacterium]